MTDPRQLADPAVPTERWEQELPGGGVAQDGGLPTKARAVVPVGIVDVRITPTLDSASGNLGIAVGETTQLVGRVPQRRRLVLISTLDVIIGADRSSVALGQGLLLKANMYLTLNVAEQLYVLNPATAGGVATVYFLAELDQG